MQLHGYIPFTILSYISKFEILMADTLYRYGESRGRDREGRI